MTTSPAVVVYTVKVFRLIAIFVALNLASKMHEAEYVEKVYGRGMEPPRLGNMNLGVALMLLFINCFLWVTLYMGRDVAGFVTSGTFVYLVNETFFYTLLTLASVFFVSSVVSQKKYFGYRKDGLRAIRACRDIVMAIVAPVALSPFNFQFQSDEHVGMGPAAVPGLAYPR